MAGIPGAAVPIVDTHAHLGDERFSEDLTDVLERARAAGIVRVINPGSDLESSRAAVALAERYDWIYAAVGFHPHSASEADDAGMAEIARLARHPKVVAVGEIGLDYHYDFSPRDVQKRVFRDQLALSVEVGKPVVIHDREANKDTMDLVMEFGRSLPGGVMHCFSGSAELAREYVRKLGFYISFSGTVTFANARKTVLAAAAVDRCRLLAETDSPYLAPVPYRGRRNEPCYVVDVLRKLAEVRNASYEETARLTTANADAAFGLGLRIRV